MSGKYLLIENRNDDQNIIIKYFNNLTGIYAYICNKLIYDDMDIEDFNNPPYSCVEERIEENETNYYIFKGEEELISLKIGNIEKGDWDKFTDFCLDNIKESKIMNFSLFNESKKNKFPNIKKMEIDGFTIYIGKDALSNDHLTFNIANKEDIWMHAKGVPGSHIVIRVNDKLPTNEVIKKAASIAKKNSKSPKDNKVTVVYCKRKFVKKEPGMNNGQVKVDYINANEIDV
jgi:predicted ribosome quality control (RQC) complex YloA/Tae2 family protein